MAFGLPGGPVERIGVELVAQTGKMLGQVDDAVNKAQGKFSGLGKKVGKAVAVGAAAGGVALAGLGAAAVKMGMDFEQSMAEVRTLLPDLSDKGFNVLRDDVLELSKEMGIATSDMVPALYQAISAGIPKENVIEFLRTGAKASIGGVTDLATAVDGLTTVVNAFGYDASETGRVADVMFTAVKLGKTTMEELSTSMFQAAPLAAALGLDIEDVAAATATLTKSGTPTAVAMTQMRQAMVSLSKPNAEMVDLLAETGYESGEALLQAEGLAGALGVLADATGGNKEAMAAAFGSVEALQAVLGLTGENAAVAAEDLAAMKEATGASDEAFKTMDETVSRKLGKAMNVLRVELTKIGIKLLPHVASAIGFFSEALEVAMNLAELFVGVLTRDPEKIHSAYNKVPESIWPIADALMDIARFVRDDLIPTLVTIGKVVKKAFEIALDVAGPFFGFLFKHKGTLKTLALAVLTLVAAWKAYQIAMKAARLITIAMKTSMRGLMGATGIGLLIIGLMLLIEYWDEIYAVIDKVIGFLSDIDWSAIWDGIVGSFEAVVDFFTDLPGMLSELFLGAIDTVKGFLQRYWKEALVFILLGPVVGVLYTFRHQIKDALLGAFQAAIDFIGGPVAQFFTETLAGIFESAWEAIDGFLQNIPIIGEVWETAKEVVGEKIEAVIAIFQGLIDFGQELLDFFSAVFSGEWGEAWESLKEMAEITLNLFLDFLEVTFVGTIRTILEKLNVWDYVKDALTGAGGFVENALGAFQKVIDFVTEMPGKLGELATSFFTAASDLAGEIIEGLVEGIGSAYGIAQDLANAIGDAVLGFLNNLIDQINQGLPDKISIPLAPDINLPDNPIPHVRLPGRRAGGPLGAGEWAVINELGIEFFRPYAAGVVMPTAPAGGAGMNRLINYGRIVNLYGPGRGSRDVLRDLDKLVPA